MAEICKFSKRCINLIKSNDYEDNDYIELLKLPAKESTLSRFAINPASVVFGDNDHVAFSTIATPSMLSKSIIKRKSSTPHPHSNFLPSTLLAKQQHHNTPPILKNSNRLSTASEHKSRVLASSLKPAGAASNSTTKSVKFQLSKFTRQISDENADDADSPAGVHFGDNIENEYDEAPVVKNVECKKLFNEDDDEDEVVEKRDDDKWFNKSKEDIIQNISLSGLNRRSKTPEIPVNFQIDSTSSVSRKSVNLIDLRT